MFYMWYCSKLNSKTNLLEPHCILPVLSTSKLSNQVQNDQKTYVGGGVRGGGTEWEAGARIHEASYRVRALQSSPPLSPPLQAQNLK